MRRLVLWDVDGTLVRTPGTREALERVLGEVLADVATDALDVRGHDMSGKTDPQIALELLSSALDEEVARARLAAVLDRYAEEMEALTALIRAEGRVLPGVRELLGRLADTDGVVQSLLTGNLAVTARIKVSALGLDRFLDLDVGAYGSDHHDRDELVPVALAKLARQRGARLDPADVWVVGDTPLDLRCARAGGARCLLVATNRHGIDELRGLGADVVVEDLSQVDEVAALLGQLEGG